MAVKQEEVGAEVYAKIEKKEKKSRYEWEQPNEETIAAIEEGRRLLKSKEPGYKTIAELMKALGV